jgi:KDO2-lipid IV(A) lauroyltransferase
LTAHFGNFELAALRVAQLHTLDLVVKPLSNPGVEAWVTAQRERAGVGLIPVGAGVRRVFEALQQNRWVAMLGDQDVSHYGIFVPFFGTPASTAVGPAAIALRTGAPLIPAYAYRRGDGRHEIHMLPPLARPAADDPDPVRTLTRAHVAQLEVWVRERPAMWFWLHRRWKSRPPAPGTRDAAAPGHDATARPGAERDL